MAARLRILKDVLFLVIAFTVIATPKVESHEWYDKVCCHNKDCAPVTKSWVSQEGIWMVQTKFGSGAVERGITIFKPSRDTKMHACIIHGAERTEVRCLFIKGQG